MLIGIVGKPNCGKSTFFKAASLAEAEIANYPFTTIKPNRGMGFLKIRCVDKEFNVQCNPREGYCIEGWRFVPVELLDVAGLVPDAHEGKGMGNQFLDDLNQADCLIHVIDCSGSTNEKGEPVETGSYDPAEDIKFLEKELDMWYLRLIKKGWEGFAKKVQQEHADINKSLARHLSSVRVNEKLMEETIKKMHIDENILKWNDEILLGLARELRKQTKPMLIACNKIDVPAAEEKFKRLKQEFKNYLLVRCSAESELALKEAAKHELIRYVPGENDFEVKGNLNEKQKKALDFIKENVLKRFGSTGAQDVINKAVLELLGYIAVFPGGIGKLQDQEGRYIPDCFLLPSGSTALDFAYRIHTDLGKNFIRAIDVKTKRIVGKEHLLKHRDVIEIITSK